MPESIPQTYITEKNKPSNSPIMLYEIEISPASILYFCEWDTQIVYPSGVTGYGLGGGPLGGGVLGGGGSQTYLPFPLTHEGIGVNALGEIDTVKVKLSAVDRTIISTLAANNGLIGCKVVMKLVFFDRLDDPDANIASTFYIDSVETTEQEAVFNLTSKLDLYQVQIPGRMFERDHCQWTFKKEGCWYFSGTTYYFPPAGFTNEGVECDHTRIGPVGCKYHNNASRYGGFPAIPMRGLYVI
jgi:lambda family phage minor tail protein L